MKMVDVNEEVVQPKKKANVSVEASEVPVKVEEAPVPDLGGYEMVKTLITKSRLYPPNTKLFAKPLSVKDVKRLASLDEYSADFVINDIVRKSVKGVPFEELYTADKLLLIFFLRAITFKDTKYIVPFSCSLCNAESDYHFGMENITANFISDDYDPNAKFELKNGDVVKIRYLKVRDQLEVENLKNSPLAKNFDELDGELLNIAAMIDSINGEEVSLFEKYSYVVKIDPEDYSDIEAYIEKWNIGIEPMMTVTCKKCGGQAQVPVTFHRNFILPKRSVE